MSLFSTTPIDDKSCPDQSQHLNAKGSTRLTKNAFVLLGSIFVFLVPLLQAQQQTAELTGRITDSNGAAIAGATVTVSNPARGLKFVTTSGAAGEYVVPLLPPADGYEIDVVKQGFKTAKRPGLILEVAQVAQVDIALEVGRLYRT